jgi:hypothetical protein
LKQSLIDFEEEEMTTKYKYSKEQTFGRKEKINLLKNYTQVKIIEKLVFR